MIITSNARGPQYSTDPTAAALTRFLSTGAGRAGLAAATVEPASAKVRSAAELDLEFLYPSIYGAAARKAAARDRFVRVAVMRFATAVSLGHAIAQVSHFVPWGVLK